MLYVQVPTSIMTLDDRYSVNCYYRVVIHIRVEDGAMVMHTATTRQSCTSA